MLKWINNCKFSFHFFLCCMIFNKIFFLGSEIQNRNFGSRDFWGVSLEALQIFLGFDFSPLLIIPVTLTAEKPFGEHILKSVFDICRRQIVDCKLKIEWHQKYCNEGDIISNIISFPGIYENVRKYSFRTLIFLGQTSMALSTKCCWLIFTNLY